MARLPNGAVCFVEGALPGEAVEARIIEQKKDFSRAVAERILEPHAMRRLSPCPLYGKCGGCNASHAEFELQVDILRQSAIDLFSRIAKISLPPDFKISSGSEWGYRCRAQVFKSGGQTPWGFQARASNSVVPVERCPVLTDNLNERLKDNSDLKKRYIFDNQSEKFLGKYIHANESVFFQSNLELLPALISSIKEAAGSGSLLLDVFCGVALFSSFLHGSFERVAAIEENLLCQKFAEKNLEAGSRCKFYAESAEKFFADNSADLREACVILDPPRPGLSGDLCARLCKAKIGKIIYVSCNPSTLARDARKFIDAGYEFKGARGFAFYPQTFHLEMMAEFAG